MGHDNQLLERWFRFVGAAVTKIQQRVCQHIDVVQTGQAGWMVLILQWKMMRFSERFALVIVLPVVNTQQRFLLGIYIEIKAVFTLILRYIFFGDFTQSSFRHNNFNDIFKFLGQIFYVDDILINCAIKNASVEFHRTGYFHYFSRFCTLAAFC